MGLGVYQPIPEAPYPGMTVIDLANRIESFPFMCDAAHAETCGAAIKEEMKDTMKLMAEILSGVKGLELKSFKFEKDWGQIESLVVTAVGDLDDVIQQSQRQQGHQEEVVALGQVLNQEQDEEEEGEREQQKQQEERPEEDQDEGQKVKEQAAEEQEEAEGGGIEANTQVEGEDEDLPMPVVIDTGFENESDASEMSEVPAGVMDDFLETEETMQDFGPRKFFDDTELGRARAETPEDDDGDEDRKFVTENPLMNKLVKDDGNEEMVVANPPFMEELQTEIRDESAQNLLIQEGDIQDANDRAFLMEQRLGVTDLEYSEKQKEQLRPEAKDFVPSFPLGPAPPERNRHHMPRSRKEIRPAEALTHMASRANAEAKGQQWETPGPGLVRKYQRGPRLPFHPEVTVGDVSEPDHIAEVKRLKGLFPQLDSKIIFECLRQNNWNSGETAKVLSSGRIQAGFAVDNTVRFPVLEPTVLHTQKPIVGSHRVSPGASTTDTQYSGDSTVKPPTLGAPEVLRKASKARGSPTSVPQPVAGAPNSSVVDPTAHFWPPADSATVLRAVKLPENSLTIRKLLAIFPSARADKSFIDVLYRSGWDLEKAAKRLEGLGLVRKANNGDLGEAGKSKGKGKGKGKELNM